MTAETLELNRINGKRFGAMDGNEKIAFLGRLLAFLITFGFLFPNVLVE